MSEQRPATDRRAIPGQERAGLDLVLPALLFVLSLAVYLSTLAPTITWRHEGADSGELAAAVYTLGIPHPPGYPLYVMLGKLFTLLPIGEVAYRLNLMSALFAAATVVLFYAAAQLVLDSARPEHPFRPGGRWAAGGGALALAFSPLFWSQAVIAEVYSLNACLVAATLYLLLRAIPVGHPPGSAGRPAPGGEPQHLDHRSLVLAAATLGLGLAHHRSILLLLPGAALLVAGARRRLRRRTAAAMAIALLLGLCLYAYLPIRAMADPPISWGDCRDWKGLRWMLLAEPYRLYLFALPMAQWPQRLSDWSGLLGRQHTWPGVALGLLGLASLWQRARRHALFLLTTFLLVLLVSFGYHTTDAHVFLIPCCFLFTLWLAEGAQFASEALLAAPWRWMRQVGRAAPLLLLLLAAWLLLANYRALDQSDDRSAYRYAAESLADLPAGALILADGDQPTFSLWYYQAVMAPGSQVTILAGGLLQYDWYRQQTARRTPQLLPAVDTPEFYADRWRLIEANLDSRPIYLTACDLPPRPGYRIRPEGRLCRVLRAEP